ncbi:CatB-related O-acetyltransferase [Sulfitobacter sp.]|uniref:CatB-related O-acetyltransferase n=1 Tax=Sulfitobacter sp. TaxID=1903071 RepID=UPI0030027A81
MSHKDAIFPAPDTSHPITLPDGTMHAGTVFLAAAIDHPRIEVGAYSYASAHHPPDDWAAHLAPYLYDFSLERLIIGKFCQIADGVQFITASANHRYDGISTYPFAVFGGGGREGRPSLPQTAGPDTIIGNDVWIGQGAKVLPGAQIGDGVIVGAGSVVSGNVAPFSVIGGNPATVRRKRFTPAQVEMLGAICWWDWPIERILALEELICGGDVEALIEHAP